MAETNCRNPAHSNKMSHTLDTLQKCIDNMFNDVHDILADEYEAPPTPLEIQLAEQLKEQARQMEEMKAAIKPKHKPRVASQQIVTPTPLEIQLAEQVKEQTRHLDEMKMMLNSFLEAEAERKAEEKRKADRKVEEMRRAEVECKAKKEREAEAARKAEEERKAKKEREAEAVRKAEEERKAEAMSKTCAFLLTKGIKVVIPRAEMDKSLTLLVRQQLAAVEDYSNARTANQRQTQQQWSARFCVCRDLRCEIKDIIEEIHEKERELAKPMEEERKRRELAEHLLHQEEARKRSAARIQAGEFGIWMKYQNEHRTGTPQELITKGGKIWASDRKPITVDGKVCVGPRLGEYVGIDFGSIHFSMCGISRGCTTFNGVTYDGREEPKLY